jgi:hypothetical protein
MPTQLKQVSSSFLTLSANEKLAMSMTWQISPGYTLPSYTLAFILQLMKKHGKT